MRKLIIILGLVFISITGQSQILITLLLGDKLNSDGLEFGLEGGANWASVSGLETKSYAPNFNLGFYFDIRIKNQWYFYTGTLVKAGLGVATLTDNDLNKLGVAKYENIDIEANSTIQLEGDYRHKMDYFLVPALIKYKFKNHFYTEIGPQFGLMYKSWVEFVSDIEGKEVIIKEYNTKEINKIDAGITAGFGYTLMKGTGWTIGAKYYYGFVDVYKNISNTKNSSFFIKLNIPIGAGKKDESNKE